VIEIIFFFLSTLLSLFKRKTNNQYGYCTLEILLDCFFLRSHQSALHKSSFDNRLHHLVKYRLYFFSLDGASIVNVASIIRRHYLLEHLSHVRHSLVVIPPSFVILIMLAKFTKLDFEEIRFVEEKKDSFWFLLLCHDIDDLFEKIQRLTKRINSFFIIRFTIKFILEKKKNKKMSLTHVGKKNKPKRDKKSQHGQF